MRHIYIYIILSCVCFACSSFDVARKVKADAKTGKVTEAGESAVVAVPVEVPPTVVEQPIWMPHGSIPQPKPSGKAAVEESNRKGILRPQDYSKSAMVYDYHPDWLYEVYCQPLRATDIALKPGEAAVETPFISDSERWMLGAGVSYEGGVAIQHIYIKPTEVGLNATLIINTYERVYHILVRSFADAHMPIVRWRYHDTEMPKNYVKQIDTRAGTADTDGIPLADPRYLSFNYRVTWGWFKKPRWLPELVYDDGKKTYITFPEDALQSELPAVFENRADVVNYRVLRNLIVIDKLIEKVTVKIGKYTLVVEKKRGRK